MLSAAEIAGISADPKLGFIELLELVTAKVKPLERRQALSFTEATEVISLISAYVETAEIDLNVDPDPPIDDQHFWDWYHDTIRRANRLKARFQFETRETIRSTIVTSIRIPDDIRVQIRELINHIRERIPSLNVTERQRENLNSRLDAFASELEKHRSRTDTIFSFMLEASKVVGETAKNLEPFVDQINKALGRAHTENETKQIEPPPEVKQLPAPEKSEQEDDIPF